MVHRQRPTIYDVAQAAGVSIATVSRVINSSDSVNPTTRKKVLEAIDRLGFVPRAEVRNHRLVARIGVIAPFFTAPSFVQRLRGISSALDPASSELMIYTVNSQQQLEIHLSSLPLQRSLDGLIVISLSLSDEVVERLMAQHLCTVLIESSHPRFSSVVIDDREGGLLVGEYLIRKGHRRLAFFGISQKPDYAIFPERKRLDGFRQALQQAGMGLDELGCYDAPYTVEDNYRLALKIFAKPDRPSAVFAATDLQAVGVIKAARQLGLRIPGDVSVVGFDDLDLAGYLGLTTVSQQLDESGRTAVELLQDELTNPGRSIRQIKLPLHFIERETA